MSNQTFSPKPIIDFDKFFKRFESFFVRDCVSKGRHKKNPPKGEAHKNAQFTEKQVLAIRKSYTGKWGQINYLARKYNSKHTTISAIVHRHTWKHI